MNTTNKLVSAILGVATFGSALLTSGPTKASCDSTDYVIATSQNKNYWGFDSCTPNGTTSFLQYAANFMMYSGNNTGFASNQPYVFQVNGQNNGYFNGVFIYCANEGWINSQWQGPFHSASAGNYPPSAYVWCSHAGDAPSEAEAYSWLQ